MAMQVGVDLGSRSLKVVLGKAKGTVFELHRVLQIPVGRSDDPEGDVLAAVRSLGAELGKAPGARLGLSGKELIIRYTKVPPVSVSRLRLLMEFELREMAEQAGEPLASDYNLVHVPGSQDDETVLVAVVKERFLNDRYVALGEACGPPKGGMPSSVALYNAWLQSGTLHEGEYVFLVDIGDRNVEIVLEHDGELLFARNMAAGGHILTDAVARVAGVGTDQAEELKEAHGNVTPKGMASYTSGKEERVANALIGPVGQLTSMIQSSLAFARAQTGIRDLKPNRIMLSGGTANLRGLTDYFKSTFQCQVERFQPESGLDLRNLPSDEAALFESDPGRFAVALGLAVAGTKEEAFLLDLVPESVKKKRKFQTRTIFSWLSGAAAILALAFHGYSLSKEKDASSIAARDAQRKQAAASSKRAAFDRLQDETRRNNALLQSLDFLVAPAWSLARCQRLVQAWAPSDAWIEDINISSKAVAVDPDDPKSEKEPRWLVEVRGTLLSAKKEAELALNQMVADIQRASDRDVLVNLTNVTTKDVPGSRQVEFVMTMDALAGRRKTDADVAAEGN